MPVEFMVPTHKIQNKLKDDIHLAIRVKMEELVNYMKIVGMPRKI
jgi:hypothetical protein